jgi:ribonuclease P protein component
MGVSVSKRNFKKAVDRNYLNASFARPTVEQTYPDNLDTPCSFMFFTRPKTAYLMRRLTLKPFSYLKNL